MKKTFVTLPLAMLMGAVFLTACATQPDEIAASDVSHLEYRDYSCDEIVVEMRRKSRRINDLYANLKAEADADEAQAAIGIIILWPTLFFLEGGDDERAAQYAQLKGEVGALEDAGLLKNCADLPEVVIPSSKDEDSTNSANG